MAEPVSITAAAAASRVSITTPTASRVSILILRVLGFILLLISLIVLSTTATTLETPDSGSLKVHFNDFYAYRYLISAIVIGWAYSLVQLVFSLFHALMGHRFIGGEGGPLFDFYGDLVASYLQATGAAAGFGVTKDVKSVLEMGGIYLGNKFYDKAYASSSLLLLAFVCTAILSVLSAYALPKKV